MMASFFPSCFQSVTGLRCVIESTPNKCANFILDLPVFGVLGEMECRLRNVGIFAG